MKEGLGIGREDKIVTLQHELQVGDRGGSGGKCCASRSQVLVRVDDRAPISVASATVKKAASRRAIRL